MRTGFHPPGFGDFEGIDVAIDTAQATGWTPIMTAVLVIALASGFAYWYQRSRRAARR